MNAYDEQASDYQAVQTKNFGALVRAGSYGLDFDHKPEARAFVRDCINETFPFNGASRPRILDCGCGSGAWLDFIRRQLRSRDESSCRYYGFDLTPEMIEVARKRIPELPPSRLRQGDITAAESYMFDSEEPLFDVIFCYDVVQQLPQQLQFLACETMATHLRDGGVALIFDQDRNSAFGRAMACMKFITRYFRIPLVPPHYTAARYPPLGRFARMLEAQGFRTNIKIGPKRRRRVLVISPLSGT